MTPLKKKIIAANPSILDLKFGCEYRSKVYDYVGIILGGREIWIKDDTGAYLSSEDDIVHRPESFEILGRPIRLADVLLAIKENKTFDYKHIVRADGRMFDEANNWADWNLKDDNLDNQSPETIKFLEELLL